MRALCIYRSISSLKSTYIIHLIFLQHFYWFSKRAESSQNEYYSACTHMLQWKYISLLVHIPMNERCRAQKHTLETRIRCKWNKNRNFYWKCSFDWNECFFYTHAEPTASHDNLNISKFGTKINSCIHYTYMDKCGTRAFNVVVYLCACGAVMRTAFRNMNVLYTRVLNALRFQMYHPYIQFVVNVLLHQYNDKRVTDSNGLSHLRAFIETTKTFLLRDVSFSVARIANVCRHDEPFSMYWI